MELWELKKPYNENSGVLTEIRINGVTEVVKIEDLLIGIFEGMSLHMYGGTNLINLSAV